MKTFYEQTIIDSIEFEGYDYSNDMNLYGKIKAIYNIFKKEYIHKNNSFMNEEILFTEWLQGLPSVLTVPFMNYDILQNAKKAGIVLETEQQKNTFIDAYWTRLSNAFFTLKDNL